MKELLQKLSSYYILNHLLPGVLFVLSAEFFLRHSFVQKDLVLALFLYFFIGLVASRIGSLLVEPLLRKLSFLQFAEYGKFLKAAKTDVKLEELSEANNAYRTLVAVFAMLLVIRLYEAIEVWLPGLRQATPFLLVTGLLVLFLISYRKQTKYITKRVESER